MGNLITRSGQLTNSQNESPIKVHKAFRRYTYLEYGELRQNLLLSIAQSIILHDGAYVLA